MIYYITALIIGFIYFYRILRNSAGRKIEILLTSIFFVRFILPAPIISGGYSALGVYAPFNEHLLELYSQSFIIVATASLSAKYFFRGYGLRFKKYRNTEVLYDHLFMLLSLYFIAYLIFLGDVPVLSLFSDSSEGLNSLRLSATHSKKYDYKSSWFYGSDIIVNFLLPVLGSKYIIKPPKKSIWKYYAIAITILSVLYLMRKSQLIVYVLSIYYIFYILGNVNFRKLIKIGVTSVIVLIIFYGLYGYTVDNSLFDRIVYRAFVEESASSYLQYRFFYDPDVYHIEYVDLPFSEYMFGYEPVNIKKLTYERMFSLQVSKTGQSGNAQGFSLLFLFMAYQKFAYLIFFLVAFLTIGLTHILERSIYVIKNNWLLLVLTFSVLANFPNYFGVNILTIFTSTILSPNYLILLFLILFLSKAKIIRLKNV